MILIHSATEASPKVGTKHAPLRCIAVKPNANRRGGCNYEKMPAVEHPLKDTYGPESHCKAHFVGGSGKEEVYRQQLAEEIRWPGPRIVLYALGIGA